MEHPATRTDDGECGHAPRPWFRAHRDAYAAPRSPHAQCPVGPADDHAAVCDRSGADPALRPLRRAQCTPRMGLRPPADALDLRTAGRVAGADLGAHPRGLPRARRHLRGHQPGPRRGGADTARIADADLHHHHAAAARPGDRQRVPHRVHRKPRRFRQPAAARRQSRGPVDRDLLRGGRRAAGSRARLGAGRDPAHVFAGAVRDSAASARAEELRDGRGKGRWGRARAVAAVGHRRRGRPGLAVGCARGGDLRDDLHRRVLREMGA